MKDSMGKRRKRQTPHAEGGHGPLTEAHHQQELRSSPPEPSLAEVLEGDQKRAAVHGKRRLVEDREQHDEAEKNSERRQLFEDTRAGKTEDAPSDNSGSLHGVLGSRSQRADYKEPREG